MKSAIMIIFGSVAIVAAVFSAAVLEGAANAHQNAASKTADVVASVR